ncbi:MAG: hypothetical protein HY549_00535 [Elusimicrobia bacterium]|nr:hypothetical protein [Elusimicrobiota bacterium]
MTTTQEEIEAEEIDIPETEQPQGREETDLRKLTQRQPPSRGLCRRCGLNKPINRLMLCYPCWVKIVLEKSGWRQGEPHPDGCQCQGAVPGHQSLSMGN